MTGVYGSELEQFQSAFDAVVIEDDRPAAAEKKPWKPPFAVGEREPGIITDAYLTRPPWDGDDGLYLRLAILHEVKDQSVDMYLPMHGKSEAQTKFVKKTLQTLGYDLDEPQNTLAGLEDHATAFEGKIVEVYTSQYESGGKTRYNHYINKVLGEAGAQHAKDIVDDIPF